MRRAASFAAYFAIAALPLGACARSEPAETDFNQSNFEPPQTSANEAAPVDVAPVENASADLAIAAALRAALAKDGGTSDKTSWMVARADLNGDGKDEALAYLVDPMFCGTGGCSIHVLSDNGSNGWQVTDTIGPAQLPLYVLTPAGADGWATLGVTIGGGGGPQQLMAVPHDANGYAKNPTVAPAKKMDAGNAKPVIEDDFDKAVPFPKE